MKRKISLALIVVVLLSCMTVFDVFALDLVSIKEGTYTIQSKLNSSMVMDVKGGSKSSGANIQLYKSNNSEAQQFVIKKTGSYYTISPKCSGLMLDVKGGSTASGANVQQYKANNTDSQKWMFYNAGGGYYYIRCKVGDKALDVKGGKTSNGTNIQMYNLNLTDSQKWKLVEVKPKIKLADTAAKEVGYQGTGKNGKGKGDYTKYGKWIGANGQSWCASFVSWCVNQSGVSTKIVPKNASCNTMKQKSNSYHKWSTSALKNIKKNDVIFFSEGNQDSHHVGIVYSISGSKITVIEGNTGNDKVEKRTYTVDSKSGRITKGWNGHYFCGYISVN